MMMTTEVEEKRFAAGDRFRMSKLGSERCPRLIGKVGNIVKVRDYSASIVVRFDGNRTTTILHKDYVELT
jgi:hypothetical protein